MWQNLKNVYHLFIAILANIYYGFPSEKLTVIGVCGTDGKTTTVNMIYHILKSVNKKVSMVSTINAVIAGEAYDTGFHVSSPDPFTVQKFARKAADYGDEFLVLEVTSHALDQYRFWGINFKVGVITNITHDHLDYHKTWENYFRTKAKLIRNARFAILNQEENHFSELSKKTKGKIISFGSSEKADFNPKTFPLKLKMIGDYNVFNGLAAAACCSVLNIPSITIRSSLENFFNLKGRMEEIKNNRGIKIIIDFAATPNGLEQALKTLRKQTKGRLISVFGSAGQRDIAKRSLMAEISARLADITVITAEDPRGEWDIIEKQMREGAKKGAQKISHAEFISASPEKAKKILKPASRQGGQVQDDKKSVFFVIYNRKEAVDFTIHTLAKKGDLIGFFGKGHEKSMNYDGKIEEPYDEFEAVAAALKVQKTQRNQTCLPSGRNTEDRKSDRSESRVSQF